MKNKVLTEGFDRDEREDGSTSSLSFRGNFSNHLDTKGRVSLPSDFRKVLKEHEEASVVLTNYISDGARCLEGFALSSWKEFEENLRAKSRFSAKIQKLENFYISRAAECNIDASGRILLPRHLRLYAGIDKEVTFTSSIHGFRIWDTRAWDVVFQEAEAALMDDPNLFADIDI